MCLHTQSSPKCITVPLHAGGVDSGCWNVTDDGSGMLAKSDSNNDRDFQWWNTAPPVLSVVIKPLFSVSMMRLLLCVIYLGTTSLASTSLQPVSSSQPSDSHNTVTLVTHLHVLPRRTALHRVSIHSQNAKQQRNALASARLGVA